MALSTGAEFLAYEDFEAGLKSYCATNNCLFVKRSSETIKDGSLAHLKYEHIVFGCKQGKKRHEAASTGIRPQQRTLKVGCPAKLRLKVVRLKDKSRPPFLKLVVCDLEHSGHQVNKDVCQLYPENRRIILDEASQLLASSSTIKTSELKAMLEQRHSRPLLNHDVYNLKQTLKPSASDTQACESIRKKIQDGGGCADLCRTDGGEFKFFVYQTAEMKKFFSAFPDVIIIDATYKTNVYLYPLLTAMVLDGEGRGIPVMHALLLKEDQDSIEHRLRLFAQQNSFVNTKCFVVDKDMAEISALEAVFPGIPVHLCCFHISQAVKRFLRKELPSGSVDTVHDLFMKQVYTESEEEFTSLQGKITEIVPQSVCDYFILNWWRKADMWAASRHIHILKLHATTTNHLESYHNKIKATLNEKLSLSRALESLMTYDADKLRTCQRLHLIDVNSIRIDHRDDDSVSRDITCSLTKFAAAHVKNQLTCARKTSYEITVRDGQLFVVSYKEKFHDTTVDSCSCSFFNQMSGLPCRHIFALRSHLGQVLFLSSIVPARFLLSSVRPEAAIIQSQGADIVVEDVRTSYATQEGRHRKIKAFCDLLIASLTVVGQREFSEKIAQLEHLVDLWNQRNTDIPTLDNDILPIGTDIPPTGTDILSTDNDILPIGTDIPLTGTDILSTDNDIPPTGTDNDVPSIGTDIPPTGTDIPPTGTDILSTDNDIPPTGTDNDIPPTGTDNDIPPTATDNDIPPTATDNDIPSIGTDIPPTGTDNDISSIGTDIPPTGTDNDIPSIGTDTDSLWPKMRRVLKPRGRPAKRQMFTRVNKRKRDAPVKFHNLSLLSQQQLLVSSVFNNVTTPFSPNQFKITDLKPYTLFGDLVMETSVNLDIIKPLMDLSTWNCLVDGVETRREDGIYACGGCREIDNGEHKMILCEQCLVWTGYRSNMRVPTWFCKSCMCGETL